MRDTLFNRIVCECVRSRQIDNRKMIIFIIKEHFCFINSNTRKVANMQMGVAHRVNEHTFSDIGLADQCDLDMVRNDRAGFRI